MFVEVINEIPQRGLNQWINDEVESSANWKGKDKKNKADDISKKVSQQNPNPKIYSLRRRQKQKVLTPELNRGGNWDSNQA